MPITSTSQGNSNASAILISSDDDGKVLPMPSMLQGNNNACPILISTENINDDYNDDNGEEADGLTSQNLFSFAWQIAKGMVGVNIANSK